MIAIYPRCPFLFSFIMLYPLRGQILDRKITLPLDDPKGIRTSLRAFHASPLLLTQDKTCIHQRKALHHQRLQRRRMKLRYESLRRLQMAGMAGYVWLHVSWSIALLGEFPRYVSAASQPSYIRAADTSSGSRPSNSYSHMGFILRTTYQPTFSQTPALSTLPSLEVLTSPWQCLPLL